MASNISIYLAGIVLAWIIIQIVKRKAGAAPGFVAADVILSLLSWFTIAIVVCILIEEDAADE